MNDDKTKEFLVKCESHQYEISQLSNIIENKKSELKEIDKEMLKSIEEKE